MNGTITETANFRTPAWYTITVNTSPPGLDNPRGSGIYPKRTIITVSINPVAGYTFQQWNRNGTFYTYRPNFPYMADGSYTFTAVFQQIPRYTITVNTNPSGLDKPRGNGTYPKGTVVLISVSLNVAGYTFQQWNRNGTLYTYRPTFPYQVNGTYTFTAVFQAKSPSFSITPITTASNPPGLTPVPFHHNENPDASCEVAMGRLIENHFGRLPAS
jgi:hypothetical protein